VAGKLRQKNHGRKSVVEKPRQKKFSRKIVDEKVRQKNRGNRFVVAESQWKNRGNITLQEEIFCWYIKGIGATWLQDNGTG
jgi:hypothetical protein